MTNIITPDGVPPIITIDGPSASGKGTLARRLAAKLGYYYLDTGAIYRLNALHMLQNNLDPDNAAVASQSAQNLANSFDITMLDTPDIRNDDVAQATSKSAKHEAVRDALLQLQRDIAKNPPKPFKGTVLDGRDTGTVVCPDAKLKIFLTASATERAKRRTKELQSKDLDVTYEAVLKDLEERDLRDSTRKVAPLRPAEDAVTISSDGLNADQVLDKVLELVT